MTSGSVSGLGGPWVLLLSAEAGTQRGEQQTEEGEELGLEVLKMKCPGVLPDGDV